MNCHQKKWYVLSKFLKKKLLHWHYDDLHVNYFDQVRILIFLKKQYSWSEIHQKIKKYCDSCITCHKIKFVKHKSHGLMKFLFQFQNFWTNVIMDFIIDLLSSDNSKIMFNFILIVMNYQQNDWLKWFFLTKSVYNNSDYVNTNISSFMTYRKRNFKFTEKIKSAENNHEISIIKRKIKTIFDIKKNFETKWQIIKDQ